eukprot:scaffold30879_cov32-Tisochrysis_lutea.AAC.3
MRDVLDAAHPVSVHTIEGGARVRPKCRAWEWGCGVAPPSHVGQVDSVVCENTAVLVTNGHPLCRALFPVCHC